MKTIPLFEDFFYHDGRGPELMNVVWRYNGKVLAGFEFFNPDDDQKEENIKHILIENMQACSFAGEEVHGNIIYINNSKAAIFKIQNSKWLRQFDQNHLGNCIHYQIMFYDEIYDVICNDIKIGKGRIKIEDS